MSIRRALVIGGTSGVGHATATALTAAGIQVLATGHQRDATDRAQVTALLDEAGPDARSLSSCPHLADTTSRSPWPTRDIKPAAPGPHSVLRLACRPASMTFDR